MAGGFEGYRVVPGDRTAPSRQYLKVGAGSRTGISRTVPAFFANTPWWGNREILKPQVNALFAIVRTTACTRIRQNLHTTGSLMEEAPG